MLLVPLILFHSRLGHFPNASLRSGSLTQCEMNTAPKSMMSQKKVAGLSQRNKKIPAWLNKDFFTPNLKTVLPIAIPGLKFIELQRQKMLML